MPLKKRKKFETYGVSIPTVYVLQLVEHIHVHAILVHLLDSTQDLLLVTWVRDTYLEEDRHNCNCKKTIYFLEIMYFCFE